MNLNSLIIAADTSRARLFRTAQTNVVQTPIELLEVEAVERHPRKSENLGSLGSASAKGPSASTGGCCEVVEGPRRSPGDDELRAFARQVAERAARFAEFHRCNPIIVSATRELAHELEDELERQLPHAYFRSVSGDVASLPAPELLHALREQEAFTPVTYPIRA